MERKRIEKLGVILSHPLICIPIVQPWIIVLCGIIAGFNERLWIFFNSFWGIVAIIISWLFLLGCWVITMAIIRHKLGLYNLNKTYENELFGRDPWDYINDRIVARIKRK